MLEKMKPLDQVKDLLDNIEKYTGVNWRDGQTPPLSAEYLNISEDALRDLLNNYEFGDGKGLIQQILDLIWQSHDRSEKLENRAENLEITVNGTPSVKGLVQRTADLENRAKNIENKNVEQDNNIKSLSDDLEKSNSELNLKIDQNSTNITSLQSSLNEQSKNIAEQSTKITEQSTKIEQNSKNIQTLLTTTAENAEAIKDLNEDVDTLQSSLSEQSTKIENLENYISSGTGELPENVIVSGDEVILYCGSSKDILHT